MSKNPLNLLCLVLLLVGSKLTAQMENYRYQMPLEAPQDLYHRITLPSGIYDKAKQNLADVRIYGKGEEGAAFEVPYILKSTAPYSKIEPQDLAVFNASSKGKRYFFSFKMESKKEEQQLELRFAEQNFDWLIDVEGSNDGVSWFLISKENRVVSIRNQQTSYTYSTIAFQPSQYSFLRISLLADQAPQLNSARVYRESYDPGVFVDYNIANTNISFDEKKKQTQMLVDLGSQEAISYLKFDLDYDFDFYRPVRIEYLADSTVTEKGVRYRYRNVASGYLSSFEDNEFHFSSQIARQLRITIDHQDNEPLTMGKIAVRGNPTELIARFGKKGNYMLCYGNKDARPPHYDLENFKSRIPTTLTSLSLGVEKEIPGIGKADPEALFENPMWMWAILILIILLLGTFTFKMMKSEQERT